MMIESSLEENMTNVIKDRIKYILSIYPKVSPSMLQIGIGTSIPPDLWRPVLDEMINTDEVERTQLISNNANRKRKHVVVSLA